MKITHIAILRTHFADDTKRGVFLTESKPSPFPERRGTWIDCSAIWRNKREADYKQKISTFSKILGCTLFFWTNPDDPRHLYTKNIRKRQTHQHLTRNIQNYKTEIWKAQKIKAYHAYIFILTLTFGLSSGCFTE